MCVLAIVLICFIGPRVKKIFERERESERKREREKESGRERRAGMAEAGTVT